MVFDNFWSFLPDGDLYPWPLTPFQVSEKTNEPILRKLTDRRKDGRTDGQTDPIL